MEGSAGRTQGWQRGGDSFRQGGRTELARGGRVGIGPGGRGQGGIGGSGIGPLTLVAGAKKFFQDVSDDFGRDSRVPSRR